MLYVAGLLVVFVAMYFVCVELEKACGAAAYRLGIPESVSGATFLAVASSSPEFFTAFIGAWLFGQFEIERYLSYNGRSFVDRFDTNSFLYLAKSLDLYDVAWGFDGLEDALSSLDCPSLWFAFTSDWLYPPYQTEELINVLQKQGKHAEYHLIDSDYGHDSFLVEPEKFTPRIVEFLDRLSAS